MKTKLFYFLLVLGAITFLGSCKPDPEEDFEIKEKISKIYLNDYISEGVYEKELREVWNWDGDMLKRIDYYYDFGNGDELDETAVFKYDAGYLQEVTIDDYASIKYYYTGNNLSRLEMHDNSQLYAEMAFTYEGEKMIKTTFSTHEGIFSKLNIINNKTYSSILDLTIGGHIAFPLYNKKIQSMQLSFEIHHEYNGTQLVKTYTEYEEDGGLYKYEMVYLYDNKKNPFEHNLYYILYNTLELRWISKNNIIRINITQTEIYEDETDIYENSIIYKYEYNENNYPVTIIYGEHEEFFGDEVWYDEDEKKYIEYL